jgi:hypothetical protein
MVLESAKDRIIGVDSSGQHVPPRVQYGMTFLLIRNTIHCVLLGGVRVGMVYAQPTCCKEGPVGETLALQAGAMGETIAKHDILL